MDNLFSMNLTNSSSKNVVFESSPSQRVLNENNELISAQMIEVARTNAAIKIQNVFRSYKARKILNDLQYQLMLKGPKTLMDFSDNSSGEYRYWNIAEFKGNLVVLEEIFNARDSHYQAGDAPLIDVVWKFAKQSYSIPGAKKLKDILIHPGFEKFLPAFIKDCLALDESGIPRLLSFNSLVISVILEAGVQTKLINPHNIVDESGTNILIHAAQLGKIELLEQLGELFPDFFHAHSSEIFKKLIEEGHKEIDIQELLTKMNLTLDDLKLNSPKKELNDVSATTIIQKIYRGYKVRKLLSHSNLTSGKHLMIVDAKYSGIYRNKILAAIERITTNELGDTLGDVHPRSFIRKEYFKGKKITPSGSTPETILIAKKGKDILGFLITAKKNPKLSWYLTPYNETCYVSYIALDSTEKGKGIGTQLMLAAMDKTKKLDKRYLALEYITAGFGQYNERGDAREKFYNNLSFKFGITHKQNKIYDVPNQTHVRISYDLKNLNM